MRFIGLTGAGFVAALFVMPAAADGYRHSAPATSYGYDRQTAASPACVTSCCCGHQVRTYTTAPVVRHYTKTYTRLAPPDCYHTGDAGYGSYASGYETGSSYSTSRATTRYAYEDRYDHAGVGTYAYEDGYYAEDDYGDAGYYRPYPATSYGAELSLDRENPWNGYHR